MLVLNVKKYTPLLAVILTATSFNTTANSDYDFISGGFQLSSFDEYIPTALGKSYDYTTGYYLRGSWNFYNNFFAEVRHDSTSKDSLSITQTTAGLGYFHPFTDNFSLYGLVGVDEIDVQFDINKFVHQADISISSMNGYVGAKDNALTVELGAKLNVLDAWQIEPAIRMADYDEKMYELRLANTIRITKNIGLEANFAHRALGANTFGQVQNIREMNYQVGMRYTF
ncbi:hypothetical protein [Photobacterium profundum]|uniref:hypothetical protein n=1 Tax=Photobacterium profundum TaxID=74109 RepID=UPI003D131BD3